MAWTLLDRFLSRVNKRAEHECWEWTGPLSDGYGTISVGDKKRLAHRVSYELTHGPIPHNDSYHGYVVMHLCDNRACVNPSHLRLGTQRQNVADMDAKGRGVRSGMKGSRHPRSKFTEEQVQEMRTSWESHADMARKFGVTKEAVAYARTKGWDHVSAATVEFVKGVGGAKGADNSNARLNPDIVREIRTSTEPPRVVAQRYGIIPDYVTMIRKRKAWKHVD